MIKNWARYQHYREESPSWIKLYVALLGDINFRSLRDQSKLLMFHLWLLAAANRNKLDLSHAKLARVCGIRVRQENIQELKDSGFLVPHDSRLALGKVYTERKDKTDETKKIREDKTEMDSRFDSFWSAYPRKVGKGAARKSWQKIKPDIKLLGEILDAVGTQKKSAQWTKDNGQFIPHPATWLNQERWSDSVEVEIEDDGIPQGNPRSMDALRDIYKRKGS